MPDYKELVYAYLAGFIDADGSITITIERSKDKKGNLKEQYCVKIAAHNCKIEPIELLRREFGGGKVRHKKTGKAKNHDNWRPCYEWMLTKNKAAIAIRTLLPYLIIKRKQAELCLQVDDLKKKTNGAQRRWNPELNKEINNQFKLLKEEVNLLNKRGQ
jgi:hypothetical protein